MPECCRHQVVVDIADVTARGEAKRGERQYYHVRLYRFIIPILRYAGYYVTALQYHYTLQC